MPGSSENVNSNLAPKVIQVQIPWSQAEIRNMATSFPNICEKPGKFKEKLETIIEAYNPTWADPNQLMQAVCPKENWECLKEKAQWPAQLPETDLTGICLHLLTSVTIKTDWAKIKDCKQQDRESPAEFMECLALVFEQQSRVQDPRSNAREGMVSFFVDGLRPKISEATCTNVESKVSY